MALLHTRAAGPVNYHTIQSSIVAPCIRKGGFSPQCNFDYDEMGAADRCQVPTERMCMCMAAADGHTGPRSQELKVAEWKGSTHFTVKSATIEY